MLKRPIAIVLNMDQNGLGALRSLGRAGIVGYGVDWREDAIGFRSRYCTRKILISDPLRFPERAISELLDLGVSIDGGKEKAVLLPTADYYVALISRNRELLSRYFLFNIPSAEILEGLVDKSRQYVLAERARVPVARTFAPAGAEELVQLRGGLRYPVVLKALNSAQWAAHFVEKGFLCGNFEQLNEKFALVTKKGVVPLIQEIITGPNRNHYKVCAYFSPTRELLAVFTTHKLRQSPVDFGTGTCMVSTVKPELVKLAMQFFDEIKYTGIGSIEFKLDERDGVFKMIELNPRLWMQNVQAALSGVNFSEICYRDLIGENPRAVTKHAIGVKWLDLKNDLLSFLANRRKGDVSLGQWLRSIGGVKGYAYFAWDDPLPAIVRSNYGGEFLMAPLKLARISAQIQGASTGLTPSSATSGSELRYPQHQGGHLDPDRLPPAVDTHRAGD